MWSESCRIFDVWAALGEKPKIIDAVRESGYKVSLFEKFAIYFPIASE